MSFSEDGPQVGSSQPCTPTCEQSVNQLPREHTTFSRLLGATSGTRTLAGAAQGPSQPCHLHAANTLLTGMLLFEGAATSPRAASILVEVTAVHDCVLSQSSNSAQRSTRHPPPGTQSWHRQEAHWQARASAQPIGNTGGSLLRPPFSTLPLPPAFSSPLFGADGLPPTCNDTRILPRTQPSSVPPICCSLYLGHPCLQPI